MKSLDDGACSCKAPVDPRCDPLPRRRGDLLLKVILCTAVITAVYEGQRAHRQGQQIRSLAAQVQQLQKERDEALKRLADASARPTPHLPAPPLQVTAQSEAASMENLPATNLFSKLKDPPQLTAEQVEAYLKANGRKASTLLAAYRTSRDAALLKEAMEKFPNDPEVAFEAVFAKGLSAEQRRQWLNAFEQNAPDNALASYLSAREYFKAGQTDQAVQRLTAASGKHRFDDYTLSRRQHDEEAYLEAGYSVAEAKMIGSSQLLLPQLSELKQLGLQMVDLSNSYRGAGDNASAQAVLQMALSLGQGYSASDCAISHLVGMVIERNALNAMDPNGPYGSSGRTIQEQINLINQQKVEISSMFRENEYLFERLSEHDWIIYLDRDKAFGEEAAMRWLVNRYGQQGQSANLR
jgi:hypothetical protein